MPPFELVVNVATDIIKKISNNEIVLDFSRSEASKSDFWLLIGVTAGANILFYGVFTIYWFRLRRQPKKEVAPPTHTTMIAAAASTAAV